MHVRLSLEMDVPGEASREEIQEYVVNAVRSYRGGLDRSDPMSGIKRDSVLVRDFETMSQGESVRKPQGSTSRILEGWINIKRARDYGDSTTYGYWNDRITLYKRPELSNSKNPLIQARLEFEFPEDGILVNERKLEMALREGLGTHFTEQFCARLISKLKSL